MFHLPPLRVVRLEVPLRGAAVMGVRARDEKGTGRRRTEEARAFSTLAGFLRYVGPSHCPYCSPSPLPGASVRSWRLVEAARNWFFVWRRPWCGPELTFGWFLRVVRPTTNPTNPTHQVLVALMVSMKFLGKRLGRDGLPMASAHWGGSRLFAYDTSMLHACVETSTEPTLAHSNAVEMQPVRVSPGGAAGSPRTSARWK